MKTSLLNKSAPLSLAISLAIVLLGVVFSAVFVSPVGGQEKVSQLRITTDITPVYSLVSMVVGQSAEIDLLIEPTQSPHHASLKPSQVNALRQADLIVAISENFSPGISRYFQTLSDDATVLYLDTQQNSLLFDNDPHTWMNPANTIPWIKRISNQLSELDPDNSAVYSENSKQAIAALQALHATLKTALVPVRDKPFMVYHDAYDHFAEGFELQAPIAIAVSDARSPGAATLARMRQQVLSVSCVFSEALHDDAIVDTVTEGTSVRRAILDPMGSTFPVDSELYINLISRVANTLLECLSG